MQYPLFANRLYYSNSGNYSCVWIGNQMYRGLVKILNKDVVVYSTRIKS